MKEQKITQISILKSVRKSWGSLDPRTRYKPSDKIYKRAKSKKEWKTEEGIRAY